jgi:hypothetical protein
VTLSEKSAFLGEKLGTRVLPPLLQSQSFPRFAAVAKTLRLDRCLRDHREKRPNSALSCLDNTPIFNLFSFVKAGMFSLSDALRSLGRDLYGVFLEYERDATFEQFDHLSYRAFSEAASSIL